MSCSYLLLIIDMLFFSSLNAYMTHTQNFKNLLKQMFYYILKIHNIFHLYDNKSTNWKFYLTIIMGHLQLCKKQVSLTLQKQMEHDVLKIRGL